MTGSNSSSSDSVVTEEINSSRDVGPLFLANFVHQVVNPLNGVIGTLDNVTDGTYKSEKIPQKLNACRAQLEQCVSLIRNLAYLSDYFFEISTKDTLKPVRELGVSVLPQVIIEALQFFQIGADRKGMKIELLDPATQYKVHLRPELLKQVFINCFDNWLKYGLKDQTVEILVSVNSKKDLIVKIVGLSIGFSNVEADNIFELGFRAKNAMNRVAQGSGIGLYVCRQIIERTLGGKISAEHRVDQQKTTFRISIPEGKWQL